MTSRKEKARRMEIRKKTGTRIIPRPGPPLEIVRNHPPYYIAYACFACRKSFKRIPRDRVQKCPDCGAPANEMGRSFRPPKKTDVEQWKKIEKLWRAGFRFPRRYRNAPAYPARLKEVDQFIKDNPRHPYRLRECWVWD